MKKEEMISVVSKSLQELFATCNSKGIRALYIWGSILTPDFNPETSDVDTIAIVDDRFDIKDEERLQKEFATKHPTIRKFSFRVLYKSELDTGVPKTPVASFIPPRILLLEIPMWLHVCGIPYVQKDFLMPVPTYSEAIELRYAALRNKGRTDVDSITPDDVPYFIKEILRLVHLQQLERTKSGYTLFSYSTVRENSKDTPEEEIVDICLKIKAAKWDYELFKTYAKEFELYLSTLDK